MQGHDELFKKLFETFFAELLHIVIPEIAEELKAEEAAFLPNELFTGPPASRKRLVDLAATVPTRAGDPELVVVHVETELEAGPEMERRMLEYAVLLRAKHDMPVVPIVVYLNGGPELDVTWCQAADRLAGRDLLTLEYAVLSLSRGRAEEYLRRPEKLAWALAALMKSDWTPAEHRLRCMQAIAKGEMPEGERYLLFDCVGTYVELEGDEMVRYQEMIERDSATEVVTMEMTWAGKLEYRGQAKGERRMLLRLAEHRFGPLAEEDRQRIEAIESTDELERLYDRLLEARSLEELGLERRGRGGALTED